MSDDNRCQDCGETGADWRDGGDGCDWMLCWGCSYQRQQAQHEAREERREAAEEDDYRQYA